GSPELQGLLGDLAGNLQGLRPELDWSSSEDFSGEEGMGLGDGTGAMQDLAELDRLAEQLRHDHTDLDLDALRRQLGDDAGFSRFAQQDRPGDAQQWTPAPLGRWVFEAQPAGHAAFRQKL